MDKQVKFALVGCGRVSPNHIDGIHNAPHATLVGVCDIDEQKAKQTAEENHLASYYTDMTTMIEKEKPDVCCILTPSGNHAECAVTAAKMGVNVLVEKPMDVTVPAMKNLINICNENNVVLGCVFQRRTFDAANIVKSLIKNDKFGKLTMCSASLRYYRDKEYYESDPWRGTWSLDGGGALMNQGIHGIDLLDYISGGIYSVVSNCKRMHWEIEAEDTAVALVKFKNGAIGTIECCTTAYPGMDTIFSISGTKGSVIVGDTGFYEWTFEDKSLTKPETSGSMGGVNCAYAPSSYGHVLQIEDMAQAILKKHNPMVTGEAALRSVAIVLAIYESSRTGKEVVIDDFIK